MPYRRNLRLPEFDYSQPGAYFVTIVTQDRRMVFGHVVNGEKVLNEVGEMVKEIIDQIPEHYLGINVEVSVIMPNHVHLLFLITDVVAGPRACQSDQSTNGQPQGVAPTEERLSLPEADPRACHSDQPTNGQPQGVAPTEGRLSLPEIVHRIKSLTTNRYMIGVRDKGWPQFEKRFWQRNYYEHIIRNERDYLAIYDYIVANPICWENDEEFSVS
jgi:REP element-mobilizing transposase RayT